MRYALLKDAYATQSSSLLPTPSGNSTSFPIGMPGMSSLPSPVSPSSISSLESSGDFSPTLSQPSIPSGYLFSPSTRTTTERRPFTLLPTPKEANSMNVKPSGLRPSLTPARFIPKVRSTDTIEHFCPHCRARSRSRPNWKDIFTALLIIFLMYSVMISSKK